MNGAVSKLKQINSQIILEAIAVTGIGVSLYLSFVKLTGKGLRCGFGQCEVVQASPYSYFLGIPVAFLGIVFYLALFVLAFYASKSVLAGKLLKVWVIVGVLFSGYLTYLELFVIHAICAWCVASATLTVLSLRPGVINPIYNNKNSKA